MLHCRARLSGAPDERPQEFRAAGRAEGQSPGGIRQSLRGTAGQGACALWRSGAAGGLSGPSRQSGEGTAAIFIGLCRPSRKRLQGVSESTETRLTEGRNEDRGPTDRSCRLKIEFLHGQNTIPYGENRLLKMGPEKGPLSRVAREKTGSNFLPDEAI